MQEVIRMRGAFQIALKDLNGNILQKQVVDNLIVSTGKVFALKQLQSVNGGTQYLSHIAVGSGLVAPTTANTGLGNEVTRVAISSFDTTALTNGSPSFTAEAVIASDEANTTLGEIGMLNSSSAGTMLCRATFASFVKATSNVINISYTVSA